MSTIVIWDAEYLFSFHPSIRSVNYGWAGKQKSAFKTYGCSGKAAKELWRFLRKEGSCKRLTALAT
jgi:hypothetical protein